MTTPYKPMANTDQQTTDQLTVKFNAQGLVPAIIQDADTDQVLMMGWMNEDALQQTLRTNQATFYSRSRDKIWVKGESSGHTQEVIQARVDCDQDTLLLRCRAHGPACHMGYHTCFYRTTTAEGTLAVVEPKAFEPDDVYGK